MNAAFLTLGCKVNQYETEILKDRFKDKGFSIVSQYDMADVYVLNSCTVTSNGDKKTRQMLHRFRKQNPLSVIAVVGCYPQAFPEVADKLSDADIIMGSQNRTAVVDRVLEVLNSRKKIIDITEHTKGEPFEPMSATAFSDRTRAFVKIEDGCDRYCSYCIIPKARGPVRSKTLDALKSELILLSENGYKEIVLVGINLSSYGRDIDSSLVEAVELASSIDKIERVRLGSLEPELLTDNDISRMSKCDKFCPQFHLSLQSGCDETLKRMNRHYNTDEYYEIVEKIHRNFDKAAITTDVMVGFAGETEDEFNKSVEFVKKVGFAKTHVFAYSIREGTRAASMGGQLTNREKEHRSSIMIEVTDKLRADFLHSQVTNIESVLFETYEDGYVQGYTKNYTPVAVAGNRELCGEIRDVKIVSAEKSRCIGELI